MKGPSPESRLNVLYIDGRAKWAGKNHECGHGGDDIYTESQTLAPQDDS